MAASSVFALIGCDNGSDDLHQHMYKSSYVLATCKTDGYTLHTCTDCGHKYADEFVGAYSHAYEYCVAIALHKDQPAAHSDDHSEHTFDISEMIGTPLSTVVKGQEELIKTSFGLAVGRAHTPATLGEKATVHLVEHFDCAFCDSEGVGMGTGEVEVPMLSLTPIPSFNMDEISVDFEMEVKPTDGWHDDHGFGFWSSSEYGINPASVYTAPTPYQLDTETKQITIATKKCEGATMPSGHEKIQQIIMSDAFDEIGAFAFAQFSLLRADLPVGVKKIGDNAFGAAKLNYLIIPNTIESIGSNAFGSSENMKYVFYMGTEDEWDDIAIGDGNDGFKNVKRFYYSKTKPETEGDFWHFDGEIPVIW